MRKLKSTYYNFVSGVKNLIKWFPIVWKFRNWDYTYNIEVFQFSLQQTEKQLRKENYENAIVNANKIKTIIKLLDNVYVNDTYSEVDYTEIENKYGKGITSFEFIPIENSKGSKLVSNYQNHPNKDEIVKQIEKLRAKSYQKQEKAHRILWLLVEHNIRKFWD